MKIDNSVKKDIKLAGISVVGFYLILALAGWVDAKFQLTEAYTLVDIASLVLKVFTASALAWIVKRVVFTQTLGKDFGSTFDVGWEEMSQKEKARWIIGTFLTIFIGVIIAAK